MSGIIFSTLDPTIKIFIEAVVILGPLSIALVILLLKRIEKTNPDSNIANQKLKHNANLLTTSFWRNNIKQILIKNQSITSPK